MHDDADTAPEGRGVVSQTPRVSAWYERYMYAGLIVCGLLLFVVHNVAVGDMSDGVMSRYMFARTRKAHTHSHVENKQFAGSTHSKTQKLPPGLRIRTHKMVAPTEKDFQVALQTLQQMSVAWEELHDHNDIQTATIERGKALAKASMRVVADYYLAPRSLQLGKHVEPCNRLVASVAFPAHAYAAAKGTFRENILQNILTVISSVLSQTVRPHAVLIGVPAIHTKTMQRLRIPPELLAIEELRTVLLPLDFGDANSIMTGLVAEGDEEACIVSVGSELPPDAFATLLQWAEAFPDSALGIRGVNTTCITNPHAAPFVCDLQHEGEVNNPLLHIHQASSKDCIEGFCVASPSKSAATAVDIIDTQSIFLFQKRMLARDFVQTMRRVARSALAAAGQTNLSKEQRQLLAEALNHPEANTGNVKPEIAPALVEAFFSYSSIVASSYLSAHEVSRVVIPVDGEVPFQTTWSVSGSNYLSYQAAQAASKYFR